MNHFYICGHTGTEPSNMGRGAARQRRMAAYFDRLCIACAIQTAKFQAGRLTDIRAQPLTGRALEAAINRGVDRVRKTYR